jgi:DNA-directed RNA polymerase I subunit RPA12
MNIEYTIEFNRRSDPNDKKENADDEKLEDGPTVERRCPNCGNDKMSYATIQLRSVDEGQTVFYTCTKCSFKESENS